MNIKTFTKQFFPYGYANAIQLVMKEFLNR